jgi:hypothetical protein
MCVLCERICKMFCHHACFLCRNFSCRWHCSFSGGDLDSACEATFRLLSRETSDILPCSRGVLLKRDFFFNNIKNSVSIQQETRYVDKMQLLMLFRKIIAVYLWTKYLILKQVVHTGTTVFQWAKMRW